MRRLTSLHVLLLGHHVLLLLLLAGCRISAVVVVMVDNAAGHQTIGESLIDELTSEKRIVSATNRWVDYRPGLEDLAVGKCLVLGRVRTAVAAA